MTDPIPVIDLSGADVTSPDSELRHLAATAGRTLGVVQVVGHGIDHRLVAAYSDAVERLLRRPAEQKARLASPTGHPYRGWRQWPDDSGRLELERFMVDRYDSTADAKAAGVPDEYAGLYEHPNVWPPDDPEVRDVTLRYLETAAGLAERMLRLYATVLDLPAETFVTPTPHSARLTVNDYPTWVWPDAEDDDGEKLLLLEHADGNALTVLHQRGDYEGLQAQTEDGTWVTVPVIPNSFVVLSGGNLVRWTNDRWTSGRHRVIAGGSTTRQSTAVFYNPGLAAIVAPLDPFVGDDGPHYQPRTVWKEERDRIEDYLKVFGRPEQLEAWRNGTAFVADLVTDGA